MVQAFAALVVLNAVALVFAALMNNPQAAPRLVRMAEIAYVTIFVVLVGCMILLLPSL
jgi:hypothetical protein